MDLEKLKIQIQNLLDRTGIQTRYWRRNNEKPLNLILDSYNSLITKSKIDPGTIDTIIYVGVDRGFIEPANACFIASKLGLKHARTFDIVDACMGWCTALQISQGLIGNKEASNVLIVSSECPMDTNGIIFPRNFCINKISELAWKFPSYTIGEAVTTTILVDSKEQWKFNFSSNSDKADLCTIPLYKYAEYSDNSINLDDKKQFDFSAFGRELYFSGYREAFNILEKGLNQCENEPKLIIPHSVAQNVPDKVGLKLNIQDKLYSTFSKLGNIATSSVPASIFYALQANKIKKGDYLLGWIASGGLKYSCFDIYL
ncbi:MAG: 3-oxoacyl-[acyl-carrier-protein] synthase III C-terminal domain-containing protein [Bacteroidales bacterium]